VFFAKISGFGVSRSTELLSLKQQKNAKDFFQKVKRFLKNIFAFFAVFFYTVFGKKAERGIEDEGHEHWGFTGIRIHHLSNQDVHGRIQ
jgi:hypothetical protein